MVYFREYQMQCLFSRGFSSCFKEFAVVEKKAPPGRVGLFTAIFNTRRLAAW